LNQLIPISDVFLDHFSSKGHGLLTPAATNTIKAPLAVTDSSRESSDNRNLESSKSTASEPVAFLGLNTSNPVAIPTIVNSR